MLKSTNRRMLIKNKLQKGENCFAHFFMLAGFIRQIGVRGGGGSQTQYFNGICHALFCTLKVALFVDWF
jgi:hypothetical protein